MRPDGINMAIFEIVSDERQGKEIKFGEFHQQISRIPSKKGNAVYVWYAAGMLP
jgi:hypothetical protein